MDAVVELPWRLFPASALMGLGALLVMLGLRRGGDGFGRAAVDRFGVVDFVRGLRLMLLGLALIGLGAAWQWHLLWLFVLALVFGAEEMLETSVVIRVLRRPLRRGERPHAVTTASPE